MDNAGKNIPNLISEDDECVFVPKEMIDSLDNVFNWMKEAREELIKVAEAMKPVEI